MHFYRIGPLGLVVAMSIHELFVCRPLPMQFFLHGLVRSISCPRVEPKQRGGAPNWMPSPSKKNAISPFFDASRNKNIGATIRIGREIWCLLYAGFFLGLSFSLR